MDTNVENVQPVNNNKSSISSIIEYLMKNKYAFLMVVLVVFLAFTIIVVLLMDSNAPKKPATNQITPTQTPSPTLKVQITPTGISIDTTETAIIVNQIKPQIDKVVEVNYSISKVKGYNETWALAEITSTDVDPANVIIKKVNGEWKVVLGPGTYFDSAELQNIGAPQDLINDSNKSFN